MDSKCSSGSKVIDELLGGGYEKGIITTLYGPGGSGKTNLCLMAAAATARSGKKAIYIDTGGASAERLRQIDANALDNVVFISPKTVREQLAVIEGLRKPGSSVGIIIVDTIATPYRIEVMKGEVGQLNKQLAMSMALLSETAKTNKIVAIVADQVHSMMDMGDEVGMVGGEVVSSRSGCIIELKENGSARRAIVQKHPTIIPGKAASFEIVDKGTGEKPWFKIF